MNKRLLKALLPIAFCSVAFSVQAEEVLSKASVMLTTVDYQPLPAVIVPKQTLIMNVDAMVTTWFTRAPKYPQWQMPGAVIMDSTAQSLALQQSIKGKTYAGTRKEFLVIPQASGDIQLARSELLLTPALSDEPLKVTVSSVSFTVKLPDGAGDIAGFLPGTRLELKETVEPANLENLKAGDSITRKVTLEVDGLIASFIPALNSGDVATGLELYQGIPEVSQNTTDRGDFIGGKRVETLSYLVHEAGNYTLPGITVRWWNTATSQFETTSLPPVIFSAAAAPNAGAESALQRGLSDQLKDNLGAILLAMILAVLGLALSLRYQRSISGFVRRTQSYIRSQVQGCLASEPVYFHRMIWALRTGKKIKAVKIYHKWLMVAGGFNVPLEAEVAGWLGARYGDERQIASDGDVIRSLQTSRDRFMHRRPVHRSRYELPALNH